VARRVGARPGGIFGLFELVEQHREAIEYELIRAGVRLRDVGSERFTWRDLFVLVRGWQKAPHNAVAEAVHGHPVWSVAEQLAAILVDTLAFANWQRAGKKSAPKPKRLPRPWEQTKAQTLGRDPIPISEFDDWWESKKVGRRGR